MADVFVSYKREDLPAVHILVAGLRRCGLSVWWDQDIRADEPWELTIERELEGAKAAIVAWSPASVASENVKAEARRARGQGKLVQVFIAPCDPPLFFGERQGVGLHGWKGDVADPRFKAILAAAQAVVAGSVPPVGTGHAPHRRRWRWAIGLAGAVVATAILGLAANLGGARDAACGLSAAAFLCQRPALASPPDPAASAVRARTRLIQSITGVWDRQAGSCADPIRINAATGPDGVTRITVAGSKGYRSTGQVIAADSGAVVSRDVAAADRGPREQWEYRPDGDDMTVLDKNGVPTTLVRCRS